MNRKTELSLVCVCAVNNLIIYFEHLSQDDLKVYILYI